MSKFITGKNLEDAIYNIIWGNGKSAGFSSGSPTFAKLVAKPRNCSYTYTVVGYLNKQ